MGSGFKLGPGGCLSDTWVVTSVYPSSCYLVALLPTVLLTGLAPTGPSSGSSVPVRLMQVSGLMFCAVDSQLGY